MDRVAVITPLILPVPAVRGGAVEDLITKLIMANEKSPQFHLDIYTIADERLGQWEFRYATLIPLKVPRMIALLDRIYDKLARTFSCKKSRRLLDRILLLKLKHQQYDRIVVENISSLYRCIVGHRGVQKVYFHMHNNIDLYRSRADLQALCERGDIVWTVSDHMKKELLRLMPMMRCEVFYNGVDRFRFAPVTDRECILRFRGQRGIQKDTFVFLYSGRFIPEKGVLELMQAFRAVRERFPQTILMIVGKALFETQKLTPYQKKLESTAKQIPGIVFTGFVEPEKMPEVYGCADVVVMPSMWEEPFGMVALEAMSMGLPLITTKRGALTDVVSQECGILLPVDEQFVDHLSSAMQSLVEDSERMGKMSRNAIRWMDQNPQFDDKKYFERFCELLQK